MAVNGLTSAGSVNMTQVNASYESVTVSAEVTRASVTAGVGATDAAVFEKSSDAENAAKANTNPKVDQETIDRLQADIEERHASLRGLVEKLLLKQGGTYDNSQGLASLFRKLEVDKETVEQAQKDIAEDGYWGVEQTSDRILDFAKALAGDDATIAESMLEAIKEGFKQAGIEWGEDLPDISQKTMEATYNKVNDWISGLKGNSSGTSQSGAVSASVSSVKVSATYTRASVSATSISSTQKARQEKITEETSAPAVTEDAE